MKKHKSTESIGMKEFLKKYTAISNKFIDEYCAFYEMCEKEQFGIYIENIIEYLEIKNDERFYENFRKKYTEGIDYIKKHIKNEKMKERSKYTLYYVNLDTFERICMMLYSVQGKAIAFPRKPRKLIRLEIIL